MSGAARGLCDANCHLHGQGDSFHVATCAAEIARDQLAAALVFECGLTESAHEARAAIEKLLPVVDRIANERAAAELRAAAENVRKQAPGYIGRIDTADSIDDRAAALDPK